MGWDDERDQGVARLPAHRGNITQIDGHRLASNLFRATALKREMHTLHLAIDCRQQEPVAADVENGGIVTYAQHDIGPRRQPLCQSGDQRKFV